VFVGPAIGLLHAAVHEAPEGSLHAGVRRGYDLGLAAASRTYPEMKKRGIRVVIGGDYGFAWTPQGTNARDIEHFVKLFGYSPSEALQCATRIGGELMGLPVGTVKDGQLADLLVVDGNPLQDVRVLQDRARLKLIMKDGVAYKNTLAEAIAAHERVA
jgi:imidazolonepropionase-like amidohydrolase